MPVVPAYNTDNHVRKLTDIITQLRTDVDSLIASSKVNQLNHSSINDTALPIYKTNVDGVPQVKITIGLQETGEYGITYHNGDTILGGEGLVKLTGRFEHLTAQPNDAIVTGEVFVPVPNSGFLDVHYGVTMDSIMLPIVSVDGALCQWTVTNNTVTGFRVQWSGTDAHWIRWVAFRV